MTVTKALSIKPLAIKACRVEAWLPVGFFAPVAFAAALALGLAVSEPARALEVNDYPTTARADYVFACMKSNGETRDMLNRCSCSVDVVASLIPYDKYIEAETVASMEQQQGQIGTMFRASLMAKNILDDLHRAQAEAEVRCF